MIGKHNQSKYSLKSVLIYSVSVLIIVVAFGFFIFAKKTFTSPTGTTFGFTFSTMYAEELGLDWRQTYLAMLDDLGVRLFRIPVYWNRVESVQNKYDWSEIDWQLAEADTRDAKIILAVGRRLPRWPECHDPAWVPEADLEAELLAYITATVERYREHPQIIAWQVENEPFLGIFGECPVLDEELLQKEIALVRSLDPTRPIMVTESGELSSWKHGARLADIVGVSMYENTWNEIWGYFNYPLPPGFYFYKKNNIEHTFPKTKVISSELQAEPWTPVPMLEFPVDKQFESIDLAKVQRNVAFAQNTGFDTVLLWGAEWWYWLKMTQNHPEIWEFGKSLF